MIIEFLIPDVKIRNNSRVTNEPFLRVLSELKQGIGYGFKKNPINDDFIVACNGIDLMGEVKDIIEIMSRKQFRRAGFEALGLCPTLGQCLFRL